MPTPLPWRLMAWNGSAWVNAEQRRWDGAAWVVNNMYFWDGSSWVLCTDRTPPTQTYVIQYGTVWRATYKANNDQRTDSNGGIRNYQGSSGDSWGIQRSLYGFSTAIQSDINGAVAYYSAYVYLQNLHTFYTDIGMTAVLGTHAHTSQPGTFSGNRYEVLSTHFNNTEAYWVFLGTQWCQWAAEGSMYGVNLYINTSSQNYYGYFSTSATFQNAFEK